MTSRQILYCQEQPGLIVDAADFDGTNDYMTRGDDLGGVANSPDGIVSFWVRKDGGDGSIQAVLVNDTTGSKVSIVLGTFGRVQIDLGDLFPSSSLSIETEDNGLLAGTGWHHVLASWRVNQAISHLYLDDVSDRIVSVSGDTTVGYLDATNWGIGAYTNASNKLNGCLAELYFAPGQYLDFSIPANRRKFITSTGKPAALGSTGSLPTGTAPAVYQHLANAEAVANFAVNRGTGGNFTITGTLDTASSSPSD